MKIGAQTCLLLAMTFFCEPIAAQELHLSDYPAAAAANGHHGTVRMQLTVTKEGEITECRVVRSSGASDLDDASCPSVTRGHFPASDGPDGRIAEFTIHYILPDQSSTEADLPIGRGEMAILYNPFRNAIKRKAGEVGPGKGYPLVRLAMKDYPKYPAAAKSAMLKGTTWVSIVVSDKGRPESCNVIRSSGHDILDNATCSYVLKNSSYVPGTDYYGNATKDLDFLKIDWQFPMKFEQCSPGNFDCPPGQ